MPRRGQKLAQCSRRELLGCVEPWRLKGCQVQQWNKVPASRPVSGSLSGLGRKIRRSRASRCRSGRLS